MLKYLSVAALVVAMFSNNAHAGFVSTNAFQQGDSGALLHQETGIEWLKLGYTDGMTIGQALTAHAGWRLPTEDEVIAMAKAIFAVAIPAKQHLYPVADDGRTIYYQNGYTSCTATAVYCAIANTFGVFFGWTDVAPDKDGAKYSMGGLYLDEDNNVATVNSKRWFNNYYKEIDVNFVVSTNHNWSAETHGVFLVSDGGHTLSSIQDPSLNANNPNAPVNQVEPEPTPEPLPTDVSAPVGVMAFVLSFLGLGLRRRTS